MKPTHVYQLVDSATGLAFYVGVTTQPLAKRLWHHMNLANSGSSYAYIKQLGIKVRIEIVASFVSGRQARDMEAQLIAANPHYCNLAKPSISPPWHA